MADSHNRTYLLAGFFEPMLFCSTTKTLRLFAHLVL